MSDADNNVSISFEVHWTLLGKIEFAFWHFLASLGLEPSDEALERLAIRMIRIRELR